ncbi:hypothetical protein [Streptomyces sp. KS 21]|uniref:hypothetical protein n=1 Tax=Streptomyces sp. KS 21 TaxID=2485150 RepID=UPI0010625AF3|nr:hypothetical protein [Streptomyces sp. KS 21]TDU80683.1 hypothetical protein EDD91_7595 [Streptomyces sp. KS 21]
MGWHHNDLTAASGGPEIGGAFNNLAGYTWDVDQTQHVVYLGTDGHVHELWFHHGSGWNHNDLTTAAPGNVAALGLTGYTWDVDQTQHVVYRGTDGHVHELWFHHGSGWNHNDLTTAAPGSPEPHGLPTGYTWDVDQTQHVVYLGPHGIDELWFHHGNGWRHNNLTRAAGGPPNSSSPRLMGYTWDVDKTQHVVSGGSNNHVNELWFNGQWHYNDLTAAAGSPISTGPEAAYTWDVDQTQHVVHGSSDGHLHELWYHHGNGWNHNDLTTAAAGSPPLGGRFTGYTWDVDQTQHVVYQTHPGGVHELWYHHGNGWNHNDIKSEAGGAPALLGGHLVGYTWDVDQTQHVVYRGTDGHVHELWFHH